MRQHAVEHGDTENIAVLVCFAVADTIYDVTHLCYFAAATGCEDSTWWRTW
jgi:hypothetical protein